MSVIITMVGNGSRFKKVGYTAPKYQITARGKSIFFWAMRSLLSIDKRMDFIFIVKKSDSARDFIVDECKKIGINCSKIIELDAITNGQATSARLAIPFCKANEPIGIYNIDTYVESEFVTLPSRDWDGFIPCFKPSGSHWSFVRLNENGIAAEVREKQKISDYATIGLYWFKSPEIYLQAYEATYANDDHLVNGEAYIAPMYNALIGRGLRVGISDIPIERVHAIGTPEELEAFEALTVDLE